jgi:DNA-binding transcriptional LysR family regulator
LAKGLPAARLDDLALPRLRFRLEELETFITVAETGSFSRAAQRLGLSQPSVTSRVRRLEVTLGVTLFSRTTRRVIPTEHGERLHKAAGVMLHELRGLVASFRAEAENGKRRLTVAATPLLGAVVVLPMIHRYMQAHPRSEVKLHDVEQRRALAELSSGQADLAIMVLEGDHPEFRFDPLTVEVCAVVTPRNHPLLGKRVVTFEDVVRYPILIPNFYQSLGAALRAEHEKRGLPFNSKMQMKDVNNISTVIGMVAAGMGVAFVPRSLISLDQRRNVGIVQITGFRFERRYGLVTRRDKPMSALARSFARFVRAQIPHPEAGWTT